MVSSAFITPALPLRAATTSPRLPVCPRRTRPRVAPTMVSPVTVAVEVAALGAIGGGLFLFLRAEPSADPDLQPAAASHPLPDPMHLEAPPSAPADGIPRIQPGGIIGLAASTGAQPEEDATPKKVEPMPNLDTVGVSLDKYIPTAPDQITVPLEDELSWAAATLSSISGYGGIVITDQFGKVRWADGSLVASTNYLGAVMRIAPGKDEVEVLNLQGSGSMSFLTVDAKSAAVAPIGDDGAALVVASTDEEDSFGPIEKRTMQAVCSRLAFALEDRLRLLSEASG